MDFNELINDIKIKLTEPLPGSSAHIKLAPYRKDTLNTDYSKYCTRGGGRESRGCFSFEF